MFQKHKHSLHIASTEPTRSNTCPQKSKNPTEHRLWYHLQKISCWQPQRLPISLRPHLRDTATPILTLTQRPPTPAPPTNTPASSTKSTNPLQELRRAVARQIERNLRYQQAQPNQPAQQSILCERTRLGYKEYPLSCHAIQSF